MNLVMIWVAAGFGLRRYCSSAILTDFSQVLELPPIWAENCAYEVGLH